jgi:hypothetical protein
MAKCSMCGKEVEEWQLDPRERECQECRDDDKASDMTVGDLGGR